jgi:iron donor protein CyaY
MTSETQFIAAADATLAAIGAALDAALDSSDADVDWSLNDGILEIEGDEGVRLVVNRHVPNREIWVAARSGGFHFAPRDGRWRDARSEWGSCNAKGIIRLNWRLVQLPPALAEYVVVHEVAHMVELNHSTRFWSLVESLLPGHAALRRALDDWTALLAA